MEYKILDILTQLEKISSRLHRCEENAAKDEYNEDVVAALCKVENMILRTTTTLALNELYTGDASIGDSHIARLIEAMDILYNTYYRANATQRADLKGIFSQLASVLCDAVKEQSKQMI